MKILKLAPFLLAFILPTLVAAQSTQCLTQSVALSGNLDADSALLTNGAADIPNDVSTNPASTTTYADLASKAEFSTFFNVYDSLLSIHTVTIYFFHTAVNEWVARAYVNEQDIIGTTGSGQPFQIGSVTMQFSADGSRTNFGDPDFRATPAWSNGSAPGNIAFNIEPFTQLATPSSVTNTALACLPQVSISGGPLDYDEDGKADQVVFRREYGLWFIKPSGGGDAIIRQWGLSTDIPVPGDFDGDFVPDYTVYRPSTGQWITCGSSTNYNCSQATITQFGLAGDKPLLADFDGDKTYDLAVWRPSIGYYFYKQSVDEQTFAVQWGLNQDLPLGVLVLE